MTDKALEIFGVNYKIINPKRGENIIYPNDNIYLESDELIITGNIYCKNLFVKGDQIVKGDQRVKGDQIVKGYQRVKGDQRVEGYQRVEGDQIVKGDQRVEGYQRVKGDQIVKGYQIVKGDQIVKGYQIVKGLIISSYCKWEITVYKETIKIGCKEKKTKKWEEFFKDKKSYETSPETTDYKKIESAFAMAKQAQKHLWLMNNC